MGHLAQGSYKAELFMDQIRLLDKWPPPLKWDHEEWLTWIQAGQAVNRVILEYCQNMKKQLKETLTASTAEEFRTSADPTDALLWRLRAEESKSFRECVALA